MQTYTLTDGYTLTIGFNRRVWIRDYFDYCLKDGDGTIIFQGDDFSPSPFTDRNTPEFPAELLVFLLIAPGDVEEDYFDTYPPFQLEWVKQNAERFQIEWSNSLGVDI